MKNLMVLLAGLCLATGCVNSRGLDRTELFKKASGASVRALTPKGEAHGSGSMIYTPKGVKVMITNEHVCRDYTYLRLRFIGLGEAEIIGQIVRVNADSDLCLILMPHQVQEVVEALPMAARVDLRSEVHAVGYPEEYPLNIASGHILGSATVKIASIGGCKNPLPSFFGPICIKAQNVIQTSAVIFPGNSGSPALNSNGEVVGIFNSGSNSTHFGNIVPLSDLKDFLSDL